MALKTCRICGCADFSSIFQVKEMMFGTGKMYKYLQCRDCGVLQIEEPERNPENLYPSQYYSFATGQQTLKATAKQFLNKLVIRKAITGKSWLPSFLIFRDNKDIEAIKSYLHPNKKILDVGCGTGDLVKALYDLGYKRCKGLDPYIKENQPYKNTIIEKKVLLDVDNETFDIIMLHHSFEHMDDPNQILSKIRDILSPEGVCILRIPVADSFAFEHYRENWSQIDAPRHIFLHTNKSIHFIATANGMQVEKILNDSGVFQFIGSEQYLMGIPLFAPNSYFRPFLKRIFGKPLFSSKQIKIFQKKANDLNTIGKGDQRIYIMRKLAD